METIKVNVNNMNNVYWALIQAIESDTDITKSTQIIKSASDRTDEIYKNEKNCLVFDFELKINGVEVSFEKIINELIDREDYCINRKAKEILDNKLFDIVNKTNDIIENLAYIDLTVNKLDNGDLMYEE